MNNILVYTTRFILCSVSMFLTALFVLNIVNENSTHGTDLMSVLVLVICLLVGMAVDVCKFIFIHDRYMRWLSIILLFVSWFASYAFFISQDNARFDENRMNSDAFKQHSAKIIRLKNTIKRKIAIVEQRLSSKYHNQWEKADQIEKEIKVLEKELHTLESHSSEIGKDIAQKMGMYAFHRSLASRFNQSIETIQHFLYGGLSLIIEVCALTIVLYSPKGEWTGNSINHSNREKSENDNAPSISNSTELPDQLKKYSTLFNLNENVLKQILQKLYEDDLSITAELLQEEFSLSEKDALFYMKALNQAGYLKKVGKHWLLQK